MIRFVLLACPLMLCFVMFAALDAADPASPYEENTATGNAGGPAATKSGPPEQYFLIGPDGRKQRLQSLQNHGDFGLETSVQPPPSERYIIGVLLGDDDESVDGLIIKSVVEGKPADIAGLKKGDKLLSFNGQPARHSDEIIKQVNEIKSAPVKLVIERDGKEQEVTLTPSKVNEKDFPNLEGWHNQLSPDARQKLSELGIIPDSQVVGPGIVLGTSPVNSRECLELKMKVRSLEQRIQHLEKRLQEVLERLPAE